ncbi:MAG: hypothetical protein ACJA08_002237 [Cyclobacteriaceae bacterium]|jgi:hypothetical protein
MESNYVKHFSEGYIGSLIRSGSDTIASSAIKVISLNNILVKISFDSDFGKIVFRAVVSEQNEGILLFIQNRVTKDYILTGQNGFLYKKANVHGGIIHKLNSFYFHIKLDYFNGGTQEIYFLGKKVKSYDSLPKSTSISQFFS